MLDSLVIGAAGMDAQQVKINTISNNISNVSTYGFKSSRVDFADLFYSRLNSNSTTDSPMVGEGTSVLRTETLFKQGDLVPTGNALDIAVKGPGFLEITLPSGDTAYVRPSSLKIDDKGELTTQDGAKLATKFAIPTDAAEIQISSSGEVNVRVQDQQNLINLGQIELANFVNPEGLQPLGNSEYAATADSGEPSFSVPGENGVGTIAQGYLEASNVDPTEQFIDLVLAQRAYQLNSKVIQVSDEILSTINSLRR